MSCRLCTQTNTKIRLKVWSKRGAKHKNFYKFLEKLLNFWNAQIPIEKIHPQNRNDKRNARISRSECVTHTYYVTRSCTCPVDSVHKQTKKLWGFVCQTEEPNIKTSTNF